MTNWMFPRIVPGLRCVLPHLPNYLGGIIARCTCLDVPGTCLSTTTPEVYLWLTDHYAAVVLMTHLGFFTGCSILCLWNGMYSLGVAGGCYECCCVARVCYTYVKVALDILENIVGCSYCSEYWFTCSQCLEGLLKCCAQNVHWHWIHCVFT